ncbi:MAG: hypothetical protein ACFFDT_33030, partial [Candidatus Hodarchaeota archaeon]
MSKSKKEAENPSEMIFKAQGKTITQSEIVKFLSDLCGKDLTSTQIRDALELDKETGRDIVLQIMQQFAEKVNITLFGLDTDLNKVRGYDA